MRSFPIRVVIADDEPIARRGVRQLLAAHEDVEVVAEARDGKEVARLLRALSPDLVFLDVQMPEWDGFEALQSLDQGQLPEVIFVTAHDDFAVRAFDARAIDYLVKPVAEVRFREALERARERIHARDVLARPEAGMSTAIKGLLVHTNSGDMMVGAAEILWIKAYDYYAALHTPRGRFLVRESLASLEKRLDPTRFIRVHRSAIVNLSHVRAIRSNADTEPTLLLHDGTQVLLSRRRRRAVKQAMRRFAG